MGMDVYGLAPVNPKGSTLCRSVWDWHPLVELCIAIAPAIAGRLRHWDTKNGAGLDQTDAQALGKCLEAALADGRVADYVARRDRELTALPDQRCWHCSGTGVRSDMFARYHRMDVRVIDKLGHPRHGETGWCNVCDGTGRVRPAETRYHLTADDVAEFAAFLLDSGGFKIR